MPQPIAICLEDLDPSSSEARYVRCVALPGRVPGLAVSQAAAIVWKSDDPIAAELWVSADQRLILFRAQGAPEVLVRRAGRGLSVPAGKPVVLLDQDELSIRNRQLRVHIHGLTSSIHAPAPLSSKLTAAARLAAAVTLGAATLGCPSEQRTPADTPIDVRDHPPAAMPEPPQPPPPAVDAGAGPEAATPIEVLDAPPSISAPTPSASDSRPFAKPPK
ncbi:MAG: hypothetical protein HY898_12185 [Deltaproteobacteria bacterium]|nr:hypothetical protein [Deltaproteobacteria bacterium]